MNKGGYTLEPREPKGDACFYCQNPIKDKEYFELFAKTQKEKLFLCLDCYQYLKIEGK